MYRPKVYTASKLRHYVLWKNLKENPDWSFVDWTATWVEHPLVSSEVADKDITADTFAQAWSQNLHDIRRSDFLLLYSGGENALRGALVETGIAIGSGLQVLAIGIPAEHTWTFHPGVKCFSSLVGARQHLYKFTTMVPPNRNRKKPADE